MHSLYYLPKFKIMYFLVSKKPLLSYICQINLIFDIVKERIFYDRALMENKVYNKDGKQIDLKSHLAGKTVGIYFSAHWFVQLFFLLLSC